MTQPFYNPRQREVLKPTQPFIYLDEGIMDNSGLHPIVCCAYDVEKQLAFVFHSTSRPQDDKLDVKDLIYFYADPTEENEDGKLPDIVYSNFKSTQGSFIDLTHFSIVSFQDINYSEKRYGQVSKSCLSHILVQYLFLWDNDGVLGEHLVPEDVPNRNDILSRYYFLNTKEDVEQFFISSFGLIFPDEKDIDIETVYNTLRTSDYYIELTNLYHEFLFDEFANYHDELLYNFPNMIVRNDEEDQRKLVLFEHNDFVAWYPLVKCSDNPRVDPRYFPLDRGNCFDEAFFSKCKFAVCLDELHTDNKDDFVESNRGLILHMDNMKYIENPYVDRVTDPNVPNKFKNHFISRTLYLMSEHRDLTQLNYQNERLDPKYLNDKMFWLNYIFLGVNHSLTGNSILHNYVTLLKDEPEYKELTRRFGSHDTSSIEILSDYTEEVETHSRGR